jgi:hypothetical protein
VSNGGGGGKSGERGGGYEVLISCQ